MKDMSLVNSKVLLVGSARGIGFSVLEHLLQAGAQVMAADCEWQLLLEQGEPLLGRYPDQLTLKKLDLAEPEAVREQVNQWAEQVAGFDHLVCCAGILHVAPLHDMPLEQVSSIFTVNAFGVLACMQGVASSMKARQQGSMVIIGSNAANTPRMSIGAYGASKAALHMLVKCIGMELAPYGIRCNLVSPGSARTAMQQQLWTEQYGEAQVIAGDAAQFRLGIPLNKIAEPADIAQAVLFLLSDKAGHITLHDLRVDGGATLDH
ncbi:2,3-dihydro-2,3-dihydroxybenzoate dehydrogenase [Vibrio cholerae]|nr:2,3-dihydro-2,3-dihydroxybenzoate dehydrogenase [Vibrio cholerae]EJL7008166.1 2,3-dihydro-2,3-dihydroxybenzoate dehydrogenase [Vibrio cholerae]EKF9698086.1 2,3-dihydro-2,3-dihydroxybenzoate dehydrogenase [Vibrio cholerae]ELF6477326.1 2,3-dihydro-2,3-dihydroxybenzoate dehydrogenase [Vibrio cholerae]MCD1219805.1 2,3-dihydro-2,3-dihydroxybenzoate dehydrogenase [Vibrio cholerae]